MTIEEIRKAQLEGKCVLKRLKGYNVAGDPVSLSDELDLSQFDYEIRDAPLYMVSKSGNGKSWCIQESGSTREIIYQEGSWTECQDWIEKNSWCVTEDEEIIDVSKDQFTYFQFFGTKTECENYIQNYGTFNIYFDKENNKFDIKHMMAGNFKSGRAAVLRPICDLMNIAYSLGIGAGKEIKK